MVHCGAGERSGNLMACVARGRRRDVARGGLARGLLAVVAAGARPGLNARVVERSARERRCRLVAGFACRSRGDVSGGLGLDVRELAAVAGGAARGDTSVVHGGASERSGNLVACVARSRCRDVARGGYALRLFAVMAARARPGFHARVIEQGAGKRRERLVAGGAILTVGCNVALYHTSRELAVVAGGAGGRADDGVIHLGIREPGDGVALIARCGCRDVARGRHAGRGLAVAVRACAGRNLGVVDLAADERRRRMAGAAILTADRDVIRLHASRELAVVAGGAGRRADDGVIHLGIREPGDGVALIARCGCRDVARGRYAGSGLAVAAGASAGRDFGVVDFAADERRRRVAGAAILAIDYDVTCLHAGRQLAVVAGRARRRTDGGVVHRAAGERGEALVAGIARCRRRNVRRRLALGGLAVTRRARAVRDTCMVEFRAGKRRRRYVARFARRGGVDMIGALAKSCLAVMARGAVTCDAGVIELRRPECHGILVAGFARLRRWDVGRRLALCVRAVVARTARALGLLVVVARLVPACAGVAGFTRIRRRRMVERLAGRLRAVVAGGAVPRRTLESAAGVAGGAVGGRVFAAQREPGNRMVEARAGGLGKRRGSSKEGAHHQHAQSECVDDRNGAYRLAHASPNLATTARVAGKPLIPVASPARSFDEPAFTFGADR